MVDSRTALQGRRDTATTPHPGDGDPDDTGQYEPSALGLAPGRDQRGPIDPDRISVLWAAKIYIVIVVIVVAAAVFAISSSMTHVYSASTTVKVSATQAPGGSAADAATASNTLAAQYAEAVNTNQVLKPAATSAGTTGGNLSTHISSGTVSAQNLIRITAQSHQSQNATKWANAVATSLAAYITRGSAAQARSIEASVNAQLAPINVQIAALETSIDAASGLALPDTSGYLKLQSQENQLTTLLASKSDLLTTTAVSIAADQLQVQVLAPAGNASTVSPKPGLYTLIAAAGALLIAGEVALAGARRRLRSNRL